MTVIREPKTDKTKSSGAYLGYEALAKLLVVMREPKTALDAATITGIDHRCLKAIFQQMVQLEILDRVGWRKPTRGYSSPIYRLGDGKRCPAPITAEGKPQPHANHLPPLRPRIVAFASIVHALRQGPSPIAEIEHQAGVASSNLRAPMRVLHKAGLIHKAAHERLAPLAPISALWVWGPGSDARRPAPKPRVYVTAARQSAPRTAWAVSVVALKRQAGIARPACRACVPREAQGKT